jgi:hypothetical protein
LADGRKIAKFKCLDSGHYWTAKHLGFSRVNQNKIIKESLERASVRILSRRHHKGKRQVMNIIHESAAKVKDSAWIAANFPLSWSGTLVFDGKIVRVYDKLSKQLKGKISGNEFIWLNKKAWLCGIDYGTGDLPHYELADEEGKIDLVMYFKTLKEIGYPLRVLVYDGNPDTPSAARHVFGENIIVQLCTRHFVEALKRHAGNEVKNENTSEIITLIQRVIEADNLEIAGEYLCQLNNVPKKTLVQKELAEYFKTNARKLTAHLLHPELNIPHTTNDIENLFKQLNLRLKSISRFNNWKYAGNYLKAWALFRRFTPFTDCRKKRKHRNGKAPIEIAGADIKGIDYLNL